MEMLCLHTEESPVNKEVGDLSVVDLERNVGVRSLRPVVLDLGDSRRGKATSGDERGGSNGSSGQHC